MKRNLVYRYLKSCIFLEDFFFIEGSTAFPNVCQVVGSV